MFEMNFETNINNINYINYMEQQEKEKLQLEKVNVAAEEYLKEAGIKWEKRKLLLDKISAQIILQNYLDENPKR